MRKLLMVLFFIWNQLVFFAMPKLDGYYVKDSGNLALFADGEPRTSNSIGIDAWEISGNSFYSTFYWRFLVAKNEW